MLFKRLSTCQETQMMTTLMVRTTHPLSLCMPSQCKQGCSKWTGICIAKGHGRCWSQSECNFNFSEIIYFTHISLRQSTQRPRAMPLLTFKQSSAGIKSTRIQILRKYRMDIGASFACKQLVNSLGFDTSKWCLTIRDDPVVKQKDCFFTGSMLSLQTHIAWWVIFDLSNGITMQKKRTCKTLPWTMQGCGYWTTLKSNVRAHLQIQWWVLKFLMLWVHN